jgi:hypothetical protein
MKRRDCYANMLHQMVTGKARFARAMSPVEKSRFDSRSYWGRKRKKGPGGGAAGPYNLVKVIRPKALIRFANRSSVGSHTLTGLLDLGGGASGCFFRLLVPGDGLGITHQSALQHLIHLLDGNDA